MKEIIQEPSKLPSELMLPTPQVFSVQQPEFSSDAQVSLLNEGGLSLDESVPTAMSPRGLYKRTVESARKNVTDQMTGLLNREGMDMWFERYRPEAFIVLFADGKGFGEINKVYGHDVGDAVIRQIGSEIAGKFRLKDSESEGDRRKRAARDAVSAAMRWGGDEFMVVADISAIYQELMDGSLSEEEYEKEVYKVDKMLEDRLENFGTHKLPDGREIPIIIRSDSVVGYGEDGFTLEHYHNQLLESQEKKRNPSV